MIIGEETHSACEKESRQTHTCLFTQHALVSLSSIPIQQHILLLLLHTDTFFQDWTSENPLPLFPLGEFPTPVIFFLCATPVDAVPSETTKKRRASSLLALLK